MNDLEINRITVRLVTGKFRQMISRTVIQMEELINCIHTEQFDNSDPKDRMAVKLMRGIMTDGRADKLREISGKALDLEERANVEDLDYESAQNIVEEVLLLVEAFEATSMSFVPEHTKLQRVVQQNAELN
jgi:hypothetical protein